MLIRSDKKLREIKYFKINTFNDLRGQIWTFWEKKYFRNIDFNLDKFTVSKKNVLRGMHFQMGKYSQSKLLRIIKGKILDVICDLRVSSPSFKKIITIELTNKNILFLPKGIAHGFVSLDDNTILNYKDRRLT